MDLLEDLFGGFGDDCWRIFLGHFQCFFHTLLEVFWEVFSG